MIKDSFCSKNLLDILKDTEFYDVICESIGESISKSEFTSLEITHSLVLNWLRLAKQYYITIMLDSYTESIQGHCGYYSVIQKINHKFELISPVFDDPDKVFFDDPDEVTEKTIEYVIQNLI